MILITVDGSVKNVHQYKLTIILFDRVIDQRKGAWRIVLKMALPKGHYETA